MENKIGIVTLWKGNYGSQLQCYATKLLLQKYGYEGVLLEYRESDKLVYFVRGIKNVLFRLKSMIFYPNEKDNIKMVLTTGRKLSHSVISESFEKFAEEYLKPVYIGKRKMKAFGKSADYKCFFSGSDQVWNGACVDSFMPGFLTDVPAHKRVAFAASFGAGNIASYNENRFAEHLKKFADLSVREQGAAKTVARLTGRKCPIILDPVLQLDSETWKKIATQKEGQGFISRKYIVVHFLDEPKPETVEFIKKKATSEEAEIIIMPYEYKAFADVKHSLFDGDPLEYLNLIYKSNYVITDSFHTTAFSIIFEKMFTTVHRQYTHKFDQSERILSLLDICGLLDRFWDVNVGNAKHEMSAVDYKKVKEKLKPYIACSKNYLETVLGKTLEINDNGI